MPETEYESAFWNERYNRAEFVYGTEPNDFLRAEAGRIKPAGRVLCLAEGEGRNAVYLARQGLQVTGVDGSQEGLKKLDKLAAENKVTIETVCADLADFDMGVAQWDAIVSVWCHLPQPLRRQVHAQCVRALKHSGVLLLEAYTPHQLQFKTGGPQVVEMMMTADALREEFSGLDFLLLHEIEREIHEGPGHGGKSAVVQVVARKP